MRPKQLLALLPSLLAVLIAPAVWGQRPDGTAILPPKATDPPDRRTLDPSLVAVRLVLGVGDEAVTPWGGRVKVDRGEVVGVEGARFRRGDRAKGTDAWEAKSLTIRKVAAKKKQATAAKKEAGGPTTFGAAITPGGVLVTLRSPGDATLSIETEQGNFAVPLADLLDGSIRRYLNGRVAAQRVPPVVALADGPDQEDFPAASAEVNGTTWVTYVVHSPRGPVISEALTGRPKDFAKYIPEGGGDQIKLVAFKGGKVSGEPIDVTGPGQDVWRPSVAATGSKVVVAWSQNLDGRWPLIARTFDADGSSTGSPRVQTDGQGPDSNVVLAAAPDGKVWMAWQSWRDGRADIRLAPVDDPSKAVAVGDSPANEWSPAIAVDKGGRVHVAFDSYRSGNHDVILRTLEPDGKLGEPVVVAGSDRFEARPSIAVDPRGRVWVAYEERTANWGKDSENLIDGKGSSLYRESAVRVACVDGRRVLIAPDPVAKAGDLLKVLNSYPRMAVDREGRPWLTFRHRQEAIWGNNTVMVVGGVWVGYAAALEGGAWSTPRLLPRSDNLLDNRPALVPTANGPVLAFYSTDGRLRREVESTPELQRRFYTHSGTPEGVVDNDLEAAALTSPVQAAEPVLGDPAPSTVVSSPIHPDEPLDIARMRDYRVKAGGKAYQLLRGEFHRHTEISQDGGSDGSLEDMWRYALDAARLDWIGNGDHDNGGGKEYTWWLIQKTTDLYHQAPSFVPMYTYERSVSYPGGHRNVMFPKRGVRTLPRLIDANGVADADTKMLYDYLNTLGGLCASHTSATGMGTDWRDNDPRAEPIVEIFQGHRQSYEHLGAPRVARRPGEAIGGWRPLGMVWNALSMQYRLGFQASSDHISTHISFAVALAEDRSRASIFEAFQKRHCYGATDNIVLDVRSGEHIMGDEFAADGPVKLKVLAHGTGPIARVDVIKDFVYVYSTEPKKARVEFEWLDEERRGNGLSWYYVRVLQEDGEIAWGSPIWVRTGGQ
jgi:hypothetical protein